MFRRLISAAGQSRSAKTVEVFGWLILFEGTIVLFAPHFAISLLGSNPSHHKPQITFGWLASSCRGSACFISPAAD